MTKESNAPLGFDEGTDSEMNETGSTVNQKGDTANNSGVRANKKAPKKKAPKKKTAKPKKPKTEKQPRMGDDQRPYCRTHNCLMKANGSRPSTTSYKCVVDGCNETAVRLRPRQSAPNEPLLCPLISCSETDLDSDPPACEVDYTGSTQYQLQMVCPRCGWKTKVTRPDINSRLHQIRRQPNGK